MKELSKKVQTIPKSAIRKVFDMCIGVNDLIEFTVGEPDFNTPDRIIEAAYKAMKNGGTKYTTNKGILPLRKVIAEMVSEKKKVDYDPETEVIITNGGSQALFFAMMVLMNPGDEIIIGSPYYPSYLGQVVLADAVPKFVELCEEDDFIFNMDKVKAAITDKTKAILLNSPSNPLGSVMNKGQLEELAEIVKENDLYVIADEVYQDYLYDEEDEFVSIASFEGMKERTIIIDSFSKSYAMTGWRIGFAAAPAKIVDLMLKVQEGNTACINTPSQFAAIEALTGPQDDLKIMISTFKSRRDLLIDEISKIDGLSCLKPKGAFYLFVNITKTGLSSEEFAMRLIKEAKVAVVPGDGFGKEGSGYIRLSYVTSEEKIIEGMRRLKIFVENL
ncbi:pyridoxal phosphate-dependent aminotransferase [Clostridium sp. DL1XJH146]